MRYLYPTILGIIIYIGCANNSNSNLLSTEENIKKALKNQELQEKWNNEENRLALLEAIRKIEDEGLLPEDYNYNELIKFEDAITLTPDQNETYHKLLTISAVKLISHLKNGKINPNEIYTDWEITPKPIVNDSIFENILAKSKIDSLIEASKPKHSIYKNLKKALFTLNTLPDDTFDSIKPKAKEKLYLGLKNSNTIAQIKKRLRFWNDLEKSFVLIILRPKKVLLVLKSSIKITLSKMEQINLASPIANVPPTYTIDDARSSFFSEVYTRFARLISEVHGLVVVIIKCLS
jgi:murein L,D-transpeptidase YcbB/YkuD